MKRPIVLIVEDHEAERELLSNWLSAVFPDCTFHGVQSGEDAILRMADMIPDIILMDIRLPNMNGIETARIISGLDPAIRIVMLTIHDSLLHRDQAKTAGAIAFVGKQYFQSQLVEVLSDLIEGQNVRNIECQV